MAASEKAPSRSFLYLILILGVVTAAATWLVYFLVTEAPRGPMGIVLTAFITMIEAAACLLMAYARSRSDAAVRPSGAVLVATWPILRIYAVLGIIMIVFYMVIRPQAGTGDGFFSAAMIILTVIAVIATAIMHGHDASIRAAEQPVLEKRGEHATAGGKLRGALEAVKNTKLSQPDDMVAGDRLLKRIGAVATALEHSHGGGLGSYESGDMGIDPTSNAELQDRISDVSTKAEFLRTCAPETRKAALSELDNAACRLESCAIGLRLM
ncbi:MAG: hypothetical protein WC712_00485 [Candidatus Brocadiia bacterium]